MNASTADLSSTFGEATSEILNAELAAEELEKLSQFLPAALEARNSITHLGDSDKASEIARLAAVALAAKLSEDGKQTVVVLDNSTHSVAAEAALKKLSVGSERNSIDDKGELACSEKVLLLDVSEFQRKNEISSAFNFDRIIFAGLDGSKIDSSAPFERLITAKGEDNKSILTWIGSSVPLALMSLLSRFFRVDDFQEIKLDQEADEATVAVELTHCFYEVSGEISAKPQALCDLIEAEGRPKTIIFCNSPSDTDLVDVFLKRRGIECKKLIGNVPPRRLQSVLKQVAAGEVTAVVVTDIAANNIDINDFEMAISHSAPSDPEIYLHRIGETDAHGSLKTSASLVAPSDLTSFQYLKKIVEFDFEKRELPTSGEMLSAKLDNLEKQALAAEIEESVASLAEEAMGRESSKQIFAFLMKNFLEAPKKSSRRRNRRDEEYYDDEDGGDERRGRGRNRRDNDGDEDFGGDDRGERRQRRSAVEMKTDVRFYIGAGLEEGFNEAALEKLLSSADSDSTLSAERMSIRDHYSFVDFPEAIAEQVEAIFEDKEFPAGTKLNAYKATKISSPKKVDKTEEEGAEGTEASEEVVAEAASEGSEESAPAEA